MGGACTSNINRTLHKTKCVIILNHCSNPIQLQMDLILLALRAV